MTDRRDVLVTQRTSAINRLRWNVHELDPSAGRRRAHSRLPSISRRCRLAADRAGAGGRTGSCELGDVIRLTSEINALQQRLSSGCARWPRATAERRVWGPASGQARRRDRRGQPVQERGRLGLPRRGCPIPVWSGDTKGQMRLSRSGDRNSTPHPPHRRHRDPHADAEGHAYHQRRIANGKTKAAARRCVKRGIARRVYRAYSPTTTPHNHNTAA